VDGTVNTPASKKRPVGGVDDGIDLLDSNITDDNSDAIHALSGHQ
jgi:hypothetical protein